MGLNGIETRADWSKEFVGMGQQVINEMIAEWKGVELSADFGYKFEDEIAKAFEPMQAEFRRKQRGCRAYMHDLEQKNVCE